MKKQILTVMMMVLVGLAGCGTVKTTEDKSAVAIQQYLDCNNENALAVIQEITQITGCNNITSIEIANGEYLPEGVTCILEFKCGMDEHIYYAFIAKNNDSYIVKRVSRSN